MTIASTVKPKSTPLLIQFEGKNFSRKTLPESAALLFELSRCESNGNKTLLYKSEPLKQGARTVWKPFTVNGQENVEGRLRPLEVVCYFKDDKCRNVAVGHFSTTYEEMRETKKAFMLTNPVYKGGQKTCGQFDLVKFTELKTFSFLDYLTFGTVLNFAFAIDFSDADVTEDRQAQIDFANNVEFAIRSIGETLADYTRTDSFLAYGFGARIPPLYRESHEFCLNLETDPICTGVEGVVTAFRSTYMKTKPCTSAHFAHVIYHLAKYGWNEYSAKQPKSAQNATTRSDHNRPQYYILNIITRGAIDDIKETVQAAIFASKSPISIIFTG
ncbi:unnamed protein product [Angiostrongylus costaricensis]|uniref:Copine domain-containing protein n=1 Tax=Angiostrongylus costaricensis TaxID=334426 RepID=A0A158PKL2_ANGCS|nr:unnamed protein product [Angiostrongylus costaricensis]